MSKSFCFSLFLLCTASAAYGVPESTTALNDQQEVAITIYNENLALIKDTRKVSMPAGDNRLAWRDVSAKIRPETALLRNLTHPKGFFLVEQNFDFDLLTPQKLLEKYIGQSVTILRSHPTTGADEREDAIVLATNNGVVLKYPDRIETGVPGRIAYKSVPANLRDRPTLVVSLIAAQAATDTLELSYLTGGLSWRADYVAELSKGDDTLDLNAWVTLTNTSGASYQNAKLQLVAGDVNRAQEVMYANKLERGRAEPMLADALKMTEENLFEYHLYSMNRPTTIAENQTKQVALMSAENIPAGKEFFLRGENYYYRSSHGDIGQKMKVGVFVEFENKGRGLGIPLPKGILRVYKKDGAGNAQFVGEDNIDHTPKDEKIRLKLGEAFDVTADKKQTSFEKIAGTSRYNYISESAFEMTLKNAKDVPVAVKVMEPIPGDWQMLSESHPHKKAASNTAVWIVDVPANGKTKLEYKVRVKY